MLAIIMFYSSICMERYILFLDFVRISYVHNSLSGMIRNAIPCMSSQCVTLAYIYTAAIMIDYDDSFMW